jgi:hypothetical protein
MSTLKVNSIQPLSGSAVAITGFNSGIKGQSIFTGSGTWTKSTREATLGVTIKQVIVEVQGAGGAGTKSTSGGNYNGGGGGGYARKLIDVSSISTSTITIGSGGVGSTSANTKGTDGGDSIWSDGTNTITGFGGGAGEASGYEGGLGGAATGGDLNVDGGIARMDNQGGHTFLGFGAQTQYAASRADGLNGTLGGGGAGVYSTYPSGTKAGDGGDGIVIVTEIAG